MGSEMCIRDRRSSTRAAHTAPSRRTNPPTMCSSTAVFMHSLLLYRIGISMFYDPPPERGSNYSLSPGAPFHAPPPLPPVQCFWALFLPLLCHISSQAEVLAVWPPRSPISSPKTLHRWPHGGGCQGWDDIFLRSSRRPSSYQAIWSPCTLVNPERSTSRVDTHVGNIFHHAQKPATSH